MIILQDNREKQPWSFLSYAQCTEQKTIYLEEGDYTLMEYPDLICIERKKSVCEIAGNLGKFFNRFKNELEKMQKYRFSYIICEFTEQEMAIYPKGSKLPKWLIRKIRTPGKFLMNRMKYIKDNYDVEILYCGDRNNARDTAIKLMEQAKKIYEQEQINKI